MNANEIIKQMKKSTPMKIDECQELLDFPNNTKITCFKTKIFSKEPQEINS